ncbi:MAG TPA: hypothetical protein EYM89_07685 [Candidatus Marinimicrobia bacterium]|nr:hypothetical protein [Candidatus Neomarinimicrobiota bacterium]
MLKRVIALLLVLLWCNDLVAQDAPPVFRIRFITVKEGMAEEFIKAASEKTKKFNSKEGSRRFNTWEIIDGPRQGQFVRGQAGTTWSDFDTPTPQKQRDYWMKNVNTYVKKQGMMQTWAYLPDISYNGRGETEYGDFAAMRFYNINPGMNARMIENARKIKKVNETKKTKVRYGWYRLESGGDRSTWLFASSVYKWADLEDATFYSMYEEVHGKGSWAEWVNEFSEIVQSSPKARRAEFWRYVREASSPPR